MPFVQRAVVMHESDPQDPFGRNLDSCVQLSPYRRLVKSHTFLG